MAANANDAAAALALQAGNYGRAIRAGGAHNLGEARAIMASARELVRHLEAIAEEKAAEAAERHRTGDLL